MMRVFGRSAVWIRFLALATLWAATSCRSRVGNATARDGGPDSLVYRMTAGPDGNIWFAENGATANKIGYIVP
jgi:hypothetical protein